MPTSDPPLGPVPGATFLVRFAGGRFAVEPVTVGAADFFEATPAELADQLTDRRLLLDGEDEPAFYNAVAAAVAEGRAWEREFRFRGRRTGRVRWARAQAHPVVTPGLPGQAWSVLVVDTTAARRAEAELRAAHRLLVSHLENTPLAVVEWDARMRVVRWSPQAEAMFGWPAAEVLGKGVPDWRFVHEDDAARIGGAGEQLASGAAPRNVVRNRNYHRSGRVMHCEWHNSVLTDAAGAVVSVLSLVLDRTAETEARAAAADSESRLRAALRFAGMLGWDHDIPANRLTHSDEYGTFFGLPGAPEPAPGDTSAVHVVHPDDRAAVERATADCYARGGDLRVEFRGVAPAADGGDRWFAARGHVVLTADGKPARFLGVTADITGRKRAEAARAAADAEVTEARRLESLAVLAGGVAHDLNNVLTVVLGNVGLLQLDPALGRAADKLANIEAAATRAAELCRQITAYAGTGRVRSGAVDLNRLAADAAAGFPGVALDLSEPAPVAAADPSQLRQLLLNLLRNAVEAAEPGIPPAARVRTGVLDVTGPADGFFPPPPPGRYAVLEVSDTGSGMSAATRARLFEPYFTTKDPGRGLGMAAVAGIVRSHRGAVRVDSAPGRGTTVRVLVPAPAAPAVSPPTVEMAMPLDPPAGGRALVADDEPNIRELVARMLEDEGFAVDTAADGAAALDLFRAAPDRFRLAVIDLVMPGPTGAEVVRGVRAARPDLPVLLVTGYTARELPPDVAADPRVTVLMKPFRSAQFRAAVRQAAGTQGV